MKKNPIKEVPFSVSEVIAALIKQHPERFQDLNGNFDMSFRLSRDGIVTIRVWTES